ncbi:FecR domain-containing protein [Candidatus Hydrogenedentota bacterium]
MATCEQVSLFLQAYADGELTSEGAKLVSEHTSSCEACQNELSAVRDTSDLLGSSLEEFRPSRQFLARLMNELSDEPMSVRVKPAEKRRSEKRSSSGIHPRKKQNAWFPVTAAAVVLLCLGAFIYNYVIFEQKALVSHGMVALEKVGRIAELEGAPTIEMKIGQEWKSLPLVSKVFKGARLSTGEFGSLVLYTNDNSMIKLYPHTVIEIDDTRSLNLARGEMLVDVTKGERVFQINTRDDKVVVTGTRFGLEADIDETNVTVVKGSVVLSNTRSRKSTVVNEGRNARSVQSGVILPAVRTGASETARILEEFAKIPRVTEIILANDDGLHNGVIAVHGDVYHSALFDPDGSSGTLKKLSIYGKRYGDALEQDGNFTVRICDENMNPISPTMIWNGYREFKPEMGWVSYDISHAKINVQGSFYVVLGTSSSEEAGIEIGYDTTPELGAAALAGPFESREWDLPLKQDELVWMVRVTGEFEETS